MSISITDLNTFCRETVVPKLVDNIHRIGPTIFKLLDSPAKFTGTPMSIAITYAKNTNAQFYGANATLNVATIEQDTKVQYTPVRSNTALTLEGLDMAVNQGDGKVLDMVKERVKVAETSLKDLFSSSLFATTQSNAFTGLHTVAAAGGTLGGVAQSDVATWQGSSGLNGCGGGPDASTTALTQTALDLHYESAMMGNEQPDFGVTTYAIYSGIVGKYMEPYMRYANADTKMGNMGFQGIKYRNSELWADAQCATGSIWFWNSNHLYMAVVPGYNFKFIDFVYQPNKDQQTAMIRWYGQLICESRRSVAWMSAISSVT
jgi:hypothetical protein